MTSNYVLAGNAETWARHANLDDLALVLDVIAAEIMQRRLPGAPAVVQAAHQLRCTRAADEATRYRAPIRGSNCTAP